MGNMIQNIDGVYIFVSDMKSAVSFYEDTLGLKKRYEYPDYASFDCAGIEIGLILGRAPGRKEDAPYVVFLVDDVDKAYATLREKGVDFIKEPKDQWGGRYATFLDPSENVLEIVSFRK